MRACTYLARIFYWTYKQDDREYAPSKSRFCPPKTLIESRIFSWKSTWKARKNRTAQRKIKIMTSDFIDFSCL
jgi:hypothetical protein